MRAMQTLREAIADAEARKVAIGHFNISDSEGVWAVFNAAKGVLIVSVAAFPTTYPAY